jgi:hypothetical protein
MSSSGSRNDVKPFYAKSELQRTFQTTPLSGELLKMLQTLYDILDWQRGEDIVVQSAATINMIAGQTAQNAGLLIPPDGEEWELLQAWLVDTAKIDTADTVSFQLYDQNLSTNPIDLNIIVGNTGGQGATAGWNVWLWPSQSTTQSLKAFPFPIRLRVLSKAQGYTRQLQVVVTTTSTIGTRLFRVIGFVRRRLI